MALARRHTVWYNICGLGEPGERRNVDALIADLTEEMAKELRDQTRKAKPKNFWLMPTGDVQRWMPAFGEPDDGAILLIYASKIDDLLGPYWNRELFAGQSGELDEKTAMKLAELWAGACAEPVLRRALGGGLDE